MKRRVSGVLRRGGILLLVISGCDKVEEIVDRFEPTTPREAYEHALIAAGLDGTALVREWMGAGAKALEGPVLVEAPFRETGYLAPEQPSAVGYRLAARRGQRFLVDVRIDVETANVFLEVFRVSTDPLEPPTHFASADSGARSLEFEPRRDGEYLIRLQPELLIGGRYTLEIRTEPVLGFPVQGRGMRNIQSVFGDPRDGGRRDHHGIDIFAPRGTPVVAAVGGTVSGVRETARGGKVVWLRDERRGIRLYYAHLDSQIVANGTRVEPGDTLGLVGNTGNARTTPPHLHFGVYSRGEGPLDPVPFVRRMGGDPPRLTVDTSYIGDWTRTTRDDVEVRAAPNARAASLAALPKHTAFRVMAGAGAWYRVHLPDGRAGFIPASVVEQAERPLRREVLAAGTRVMRAPHVMAPAVDSVAADLQVDVLGRFGEFLFVQGVAGRAGWVGSGLSF